MRDFVGEVNDNSFHMYDINMWIAKLLFRLIDCININSGICGRFTPVGFEI